MFKVLFLLKVTGWHYSIQTKQKKKRTPPSYLALHDTLGYFLLEWVFLKKKKKILTAFGNFKIFLYNSIITPHPTGFKVTLNFFLSMFNLQKKSYSCKCPRF